MILELHLLTAINASVNLLQSNRGLKHLSLYRFDPILWDKEQDKLSFPSGLTLDLFTCQHRLNHELNILHTLFKIFPLCKTIEITSQIPLHPVAKYQELKQFALSNRKLRFILVKQRNWSIKPTSATPNNVISGFCENEFNATDFCFNVPLRSDLDLAHGIEMGGFNTDEITSFLIIDVQKLRRKVCELSII